MAGVNRPRLTAPGDAHITVAMLRALALSIGQLGDPAFLRVLGKSLALTLAIFVALGVALYFLLHWLFGWLGWGDAGGFAAAAGAAILAALSFWLLFRAAAIAVIGFFADEIVEAVERRHYPDRHARAMRPGIGEQLRTGLASAGRAIGWNLLALPLYFVPIVNIAAFFLVNALLLARDLGEMVAVRHVPRAGRRDWLRSTRGRRMQAGLVSAALFVIPVVNLLAPILGAAMAAHLLHGRGMTDA